MLSVTGTATGTADDCCACNLFRHLFSGKWDSYREALLKKHTGGTMAEDLNAWVERARRGDLDAYDCIVRRLQDTAVGYAYSILRDFGWAQDAAQEAFLEACVACRNCVKSQRSRHGCAASSSNIVTA